jgi:hypothetical protein
MTLSEQSAILLEAIEDELLQPEDIVRWAAEIIVAMDKPPTWIIELSTLGSPHMTDFASRLREQAPATLPLRRQIQVVVLAHQAGLLSLSAALSQLFRITILDRGKQPLDASATRLQDLLVEWDCLDYLDVVEPTLEAKYEAMFREYLKDAEDIRTALPWKFGKAA